MENTSQPPNPATPTSAPAPAATIQTAMGSGIVGTPPPPPAPSPFAGTPAPVSPFAAPTAGAPAPFSPEDLAGASAAGDTSFLDEVPSHEPLIKNCVVPGVITALEVKTSPTTGNAYLAIAVQLYGDKMVNETGDPVPPGKRLTSMLFASSKTDEGLKRAGRTLKNTLLALHNVPLDGKGDQQPDVVYKGWPQHQKIALVPTPSGGAGFSLAPFAPGEKWVGTKVLVEVRTGKDMDGNRRNEFNLLAAATKPVERKGR